MAVGLEKGGTNSCTASRGFLCGNENVLKLIAASICDYAKNIEL